MNVNKKIAAAALAFAIIAPAGIVFAQESQTIPAASALREQNKQLMQEKREAGKEALATEREAAKKIVTEKREQTKQGLETLKQQKRLEFQDKKEKMAAEKCQNIEAKISTRTNRYENTGKMLQNVYGNMRDRLSRLTAKLKSAGADTTQLETDLATLNIKIDKLFADQANFMLTLKESQNFVCGKSEGEFKNKLEQARKVPEVIKQDREDIKKFFQGAIKTDLQTIRKQLALTQTETEIKEDGEKLNAKKARINAPNPALQNEVKPLSQ